MSAEILDSFTTDQIAAGERRAAYADLCVNDGLGAVSSERQDLWSDPEYPDTWQDGFDAIYSRVRAILLRKFKILKPHTAIDNADEGAAIALERYRAAYMANKAVHKIPLSRWIQTAYWAVLSGRSFTRCNGQRGNGRAEPLEDLIREPFVQGDGKRAECCSEACDEGREPINRSGPYRQRSYSVDFSLDFIAWTKQLTETQRRAALLLAVGNSTGEAAKALGVSCSAISLMRRMLERLWIEWDRR